MLTFDILATVYLYPAAYSGKKFPISMEFREYFGCPIVFEQSSKQAYDCRMYLHDIKIINFGDTCKNVAIKFLDWDTVKFLIPNYKRFIFGRLGLLKKG